MLALTAAAPIYVVAALLLSDAVPDVQVLRVLYPFAVLVGLALAARAVVKWAFPHPR